MADIILYTDFVGKISLPNTAPTHTEGANLAIYIDDFEAQYLSEILGYKMAKDFLTAIALNPASGVWFDLWKGAEFTDSLGRLNKWVGFRNSDSELAIANFIYCKYIEQMQTQSTGVGEKATNSTNAVSATPIQKVCNAWNRMVDLNCILHEFIMANETDYPDYIGLNNQVNKYFFIKRNIFGI